LDFGSMLVHDKLREVHYKNKPEFIVFWFRVGAQRLP
jgi:hypothetical protein